MPVQGKTRSQGFTLIELMIVVALIGVLTSIAIPGFQRYQMTSKRAEAYTNLQALATAQKSYFSEWNKFVAVLPEPSSTLGIDPGPQKRSAAAVVGAFAPLGWAPTGGVYFDYDSCASGGSVSCACSCPSCFTATAWGDLDDDGGMSGYMYFQPDESGATCASLIGGFGPPVVDGQLLFQTPGWNGSTDDF